MEFEEEPVLHYILQMESKYEKLRFLLIHNTHLLLESNPLQYFALERGSLSNRNQIHVFLEFFEEIEFTYNLLCILDVSFNQIFGNQVLFSIDFKLKP